MIGNGGLVNGNRLRSINLCRIDVFSSPSGKGEGDGRTTNVLIFFSCDATLLDLFERKELSRGIRTPPNSLLHVNCNLAELSRN